MSEAEQLPLSDGPWLAKSSTSYLKVALNLGKSLGLRASRRRAPSRRRPIWWMFPRGTTEARSFEGCEPSSKSRCRDLNPGLTPYQGVALPG